MGISEEVYLFMGIVKGVGRSWVGQVEATSPMDYFLLQFILHNTALERHNQMGHNGSG